MQIFENKIYRSKIDWGVFVGIFLASMLPSFMVFASKVTLTLFIVIPVIFFVIIAFLGLILYIGRRTTYTFKAEGLRVYSPAYYNSLILYSEISSVEKLKTWGTAPACSLSRIKIKFGNENKSLDSKSEKSVLISPPDRDAFIADINARIEAAK